jgi:hypothetical protein
MRNGEGWPTRCFMKKIDMETKTFLTHQPELVGFSFALFFRRIFVD